MFYIIYVICIIYCIYITLCAKGTMWIPRTVFEFLVFLFVIYLLAYNFRGRALVRARGGEWIGGAAAARADRICAGFTRGSAAVASGCSTCT